MGDRRHKRSYPEGKRLQMTDDWKRSVVEAMRARGITASDLARHINADKSAITRMLGDQQASKLVTPICAYLEIAPPMRPTRSKDDLDDEVETLSDQERRQTLAFIRGVLRG